MFLRRPTKQLWEAAKQTLWYLGKSAHMEVLFCAKLKKAFSRHQIKTWDKSKNLWWEILWRSWEAVRFGNQKKNVVTKSDTEEEHVSLAGYVKDISWDKKHQKIIPKMVDRSTVEYDFDNVIWENMQARIKHSKALVTNEYTKHVDLKYWVLTGLLSKCQLELNAHQSTRC